MVFAFFLGRFIGKGPSALRGLGYLRSMYHQYAIMAFGVVILVEGNCHGSSAKDKFRLVHTMMRELAPGVMTSGPSTAFTAAPRRTTPSPCKSS